MHLVGYLYYWQMGFNSVFKGLTYLSGAREPLRLMGLIHSLNTPRKKSGIQRNCNGTKEIQQEMKDDYATNDKHCNKNIRLLAPKLETISSETSQSPRRHISKYGNVYRRRYELRPHRSVNTSGVRGDNVSCCVYFRCLLC